MTEPIVGRRNLEEPWRVEDLFNAPDDGMRRELFDGTLLVTPPAGVFHAHAATELQRLLDRTLPADLYATVAGVGVYVSDDTYYIPDLLVFRRSAIGSDANGVKPADVRLVVEVLSRSNSKQDLVLKRLEYAAAGIPMYWIVDLRERALTVLTLERGRRHYTESAQVKAGERFTTEQPFPIEFDPAEIF